MQPAQNTHPTLTENPVQIPADSPLEALLTLQRQNAVIIKELKAANGKLTFFVVVLILAIILQAFATLFAT